MELKEHNNKIYLHSFCLEEIAEQYGTPFFLYDLATVEEKIAAFRQHFGKSAELFYAVKANSNLALLEAMRTSVDGLDISSAGEMDQSLLAGYGPGQLSFAGPGKTPRELRKAVVRDIGMLSVESLRELHTVKEIAEQGGYRPNIVLRINPELHIKEFAIKMGGRPTQFGIDEEDLPAAADYIKHHQSCFHFLGIHVYAGTQCLNEDALVRNVQNTVSIARHVEKKYGLACSLINLGGGFGVSYYDETTALDLAPVSRGLRMILDQCGAEKAPRFIVELGRYLVADAGIYVSRVVSEKQSRGEKFVVLDGGMNHHLAASGNLGSMLRKNFVAKNLSSPGGPEVNCSLVGPLCTPLDLMGKNVSLASPGVGDLVGFLKSGSYAFTASPLLFLGHETPVELLVEKDTIKIVRPAKKLTDFN